MGREPSPVATLITRPCISAPSADHCPERTPSRALVGRTSNRQDFQALLASFLDLLKLDEEYWQTLSEHEAALGQIEELSGVSLR